MTENRIILLSDSDADSEVLTSMLIRGEMKKESFINWASPIGIIQEHIMSLDWTITQTPSISRLSSFTLKKESWFHFKWKSQSATISSTKLVRMITAAHQNDATHIVFRNLSNIIEIVIKNDRFYMMNDHTQKDFITTINHLPHETH